MNLEDKKQNPKNSARRDIHDSIAVELLENKSVAAFVWLINRGREFEFSYQGKPCFVSKSQSISEVSLYVDEVEFGFESVEELWESAEIGKEKLCEIWHRIEIETLF